MDDGVYAVGGVVGLRIRKRNGTIRYLMRWTRHRVRTTTTSRVTYRSRKHESLARSVGISWTVVKIR